MRLPEQEDRRRSGRWVREFYTLALPFWQSSSSPRALFFLAGIIGTICVSVYLHVRLNFWYRDVFNAAPAAGASTYVALFGEYAWIMVAAIAASRMGALLKYRLRIFWREWMTRRFLTSWLENQRHYFWSLTQKNTDNPDQRIAEDVLIFVNSTINLFADLLERAITLGCFVGVLWQLSNTIHLSLSESVVIPISGYLVWTSLIYALVFNIIIQWVGGALIPLQYEQQHKEADFRFSLVRIRENSENIALARGESAEIRGAMSLFGEVVNNYRSLTRKYVQLEAFEELHKQMRWVFPYLLAVPSLLAGSLRIGGLLQISNAFEKVESSVSFFVSSFKTIADWRSALRRLADLEESLVRAESVNEEVRSHKVSFSSPTGEWRLETLHVFSPEGRALIKGLSLDFRCRRRIMIRGSSGCGKSTLFRVLAANWPYFEGTVTGPQREKTIFLSQTSYLPVGSLRHALSYPGLDGNTGDAELMDCLRSVKLAHLCGQLDTQQDWQAILSPGERQRIVIVRAILQRPEWLFLDEATAALDEESQRSVYELVLRELPESGVVSIGHQREIEKFHDEVIDIESVDATENLQAVEERKGA